MSKNQNKMVTIVCCYNDGGQYQKFCTSLENQNVAYELVGIDNRAQKFSSCSSALNAALSSVNTEYVHLFPSGYRTAGTGYVGEISRVSWADPGKVIFSVWRVRWMQLC